ncbi:hypothetical protein CEXT_247651 [Caerostris extrusa]|uniref:Uncharacterized protein n=1 Tax=Caerostris extrusa TaxID=172846 RepID=A0AAV4M2Y9_CAEEX|nr:hypothetical protein CEXT_247651 [Caerostris extrusa]
MAPPHPSHRRESKPKHVARPFRPHSETLTKPVVPKPREWSSGRQKIDSLESTVPKKGPRKIPSMPSTRTKEKQLLLLGC